MQLQPGTATGVVDWTEHDNDLVLLES